MMKQDMIAPSFMRTTNSNNQPTTTPPAKRSLWRNRSTSEGPSVNRSPITKAFDFLPWTRSKKTTEKPTTAIKTHTNLIQDEKKDSTAHYHRNIFRSGGGVIRDILSDKTNKEKVPNCRSNNSKKDTQRKTKQIMARNKSLDINELIDCVEKQDAAEKQIHGRSMFIDDTFIENIIRNRNDYRLNLAAAEDDDDYFYGSSELDHQDGYNTNSVQYQNDAQTYFANESVHSNVTTTRNITTSISTNATHTGGLHSHNNKHILFNDENTVYLIKKELPVNQEISKSIGHTGLAKNNKKLLPNHGSNYEKEDVKNEHSENSVLKARLKLKKLSPETTPKSTKSTGIDIMDNNHTVSGSFSNQRNYHPPKALNDTCGNIIGKRSLLQRQNTSPTETYPNVITTPEVGRRHNQLHQRSEQRVQMRRRKSLTDGFYDSAQFDNNGAASNLSSGAGVMTFERPKTDKPRKKLSFREPVVAERNRTRRLSSPTQHSHCGTHSSGCGGNSKVVAVGGAVDGGYVEVPTTATAMVIKSGNNGNCDNLSKSPTQDSRFAKCNNMSGETPGCGFMDNNEFESQAMRIVRTVGQAFEVCHKFNLHKNSVDHNDERSDASSELLDVDRISEQQLSDDEITKKEQLTVTPDINPPQRPNYLELVPQTNLNVRKSGSVLTDDDKSPTTPSSPSREIMKLKEQLEQQALQTRQTMAQLLFVREQLISETNLRMEAQARTQQLLQQNRELLEHLASLGGYTDQQTTGLTSANIAMAPQTQLPILLQTASNNNSLAAINQQINNLGSLNQQITTLSQQLSGLNQQSQNLQNFQNINTNLTQQAQQNTQQQPQTSQPLTPPTILQQSQLHLNVSTANNNNNTGTLSTSPFHSMNQLQNINSQLHQLNLQSTQPQQDAANKDLFQLNQELLNRIQALNLGASTSTSLALRASPLPGTVTPQTSQNSYFFVNPMSCSPSNNNNNFLSTSSLLSNLTPSPMGTLNRNSYSNSPITDEMHLSIDKNLNNLDEQMMKINAAVSTSNIATTSGTRESSSHSSSTLDSPSSRPNCANINNNEQRFNTVMLKVTDEAGNVTNQRKLSATPSFITRSTSEKVPNRSQMMSHVQRTAWARHTTK